MNLSSIINKVQEGEISLFTFLLFLAIAIGIFFFLIAIIWRLLKKIKSLSQIRYGFGGKPLFSLLAVLFITLAIPLTLYAAQRSINYVNIARASKDVLVEIYQKEINEDVYEVTMLAIPLVNDESWGGKTYDIEWVISGDKNVTRKEENRNSENLSYVTETLSGGSYKIRVIVISENFNVIRTEELILE